MHMYIVEHFSLVQIGHWKSHMVATLPKITLTDGMT